MRENYQKPIKNWQFESAEDHPPWVKPEPKELGGNIHPSGVIGKSNSKPQSKFMQAYNKETGAAATQDEATKAPKRKIKIKDLPEAERIKWKNVHKGK